MADNESNLGFPFLFPVCQCGCKHTIAAAYKKEKVAVGLMKEDTPIFTSQFGFALADMREQHLSVDLGIAFKDICMQCGMERIVRVDKMQGMVGMQPSGMPSGGLKTQFGKPLPFRNG